MQREAGEVQLCGCQEEGGHRVAQREGKAWRIPSREELVALVDMTTKKKPRIDSQAFPQTPAKLFWATRAGTDDDLNAWLVSFANGKVRANNGQSKFPLRLVRAGADRRPAVCIDPHGALPCRASRAALDATAHTRSPLSNIGLPSTGDPAMPWRNTTRPRAHPASTANENACRGRSPPG